MPSIILECPHCGAEKIGFNLAAEAPARRRPPGGVQRFRVLLICSNCEEGMVALFDSRSTVQGSPCHYEVNPTEMGWSLTDTYPKPQPSTCPDHTPDGLKRIFLQAANALKRGDHDAS